MPVDQVYAFAMRNTNAHTTIILKFKLRDNSGASQGYAGHLNFANFDHRLSRRSRTLHPVVFSGDCESFSNLIILPMVREASVLRTSSLVSHSFADKDI